MSKNLTRFDAANIARAIAQELDLSIALELEDGDSVHFNAIGSDVLTAIKNLASLLPELGLYDHNTSGLEKYLNKG